jgi:hypothetical protein
MFQRTEPIFNLDLARYEYPTCESEERIPTASVTTSFGMSDSRSRMRRNGLARTSPPTRQRLFMQMPFGQLAEEAISGAEEIGNKEKETEH